jgi:hypothetical protein
MSVEQSEGEKNSDEIAISEQKVNWQFSKGRSRRRELQQLKYVAMYLKRLDKRKKTRDLQAPQD